MRDVMIAGALLGALHGSMMPVMAGEDKITKGYHTMDAMGCMLLQECTNGVQQIKSSKDLRKAFPDSDWSPVADEFDKIMKSFSQIGTNVYLADPKYFPLVIAVFIILLAIIFISTRITSIVHTS